MSYSDDSIVKAAAAIAKEASDGKEPHEAVVSLLRAIAMTKDEATRHELARQAAARAGQLTDVALQLLRITIFSLAA